MPDVQKRHVFNFQSRMVLDIRGYVNISSANISDELSPRARADCDGFYGVFCKFVYDFDFFKCIGRF